MTSGRRLGSVSLAACVSQGQLQASSGVVTRITPPLPRLVKRPGGSWCACVGGDCCPPKKLKITEVISLAEEKVLKLLEQYLVTFAYSTCLLA